MSTSLHDAVHDLLVRGQAERGQVGGADRVSEDQRSVPRRDQELVEVGLIPVCRLDGGDLLVAGVVDDEPVARNSASATNGRFGKNRRGNLELLEKLGAQFDFNVIGIPPVTVNGELVSSTTIRRAVESGDLQKAAAMLGGNIRFWAQLCAARISEKKIWLSNSKSER